MPFSYGIVADFASRRVTRLMDSLSRIGLKTPITLRATDDGDLLLVAGLHRLEAARRLGWEEIQATITYDWTADEARMWEISENLARAELTALERDEHVAEWIRLADLQSAQVAPNETKREDGRGHRHEGGVRKASRDLGIDRDDARRVSPTWRNGSRPLRFRHRSEDGPVRARPTRRRAR